jgi:hypothetical protein
MPVSIFNFIFMFVKKMCYCDTLLCFVINNKRLCSLPSDVLDFAQFGRDFTLQCKSTEIII